MQGGGKFGKRSSHQNGLDVDIRYLRADGEEQGFSFNSGSSGYDKAATQALVDLIVAQGLDIVIGHDDADLDFGTVTFRHRDDHHDHLHFRFKHPDDTGN